uniref:Ribosomal protein L10 n=1 Tax=Leiosporoceros dussii TaxID=263836 RepID=A0A385KE76_9EMBR|nr:ribosomal protein L10 [Leiosporoceros dussii]AXZ70970.1 ribosomal protein L10 [Leiosporoceros dussii]
MQVRKNFLKKKHKQEIDKKSLYILLFCYSGLINKSTMATIQNLLCAIYDKTLFQPSRNMKPHENQQNGFLAQHASKASPTSLLYLTKKTPNETWSVAMATLGLLQPESSFTIRKTRIYFTKSYAYKRSC